MSKARLTNNLHWCRLLCVEHVEEHNKPCLYLVNYIFKMLSRSAICVLCARLAPDCVQDTLPTQVFEYLSTDLKKFMDRTGKGNANPMPSKLIKVC